MYVSQKDGVDLLGVRTTDNGRKLRSENDTKSRGSYAIFINFFPNYLYTVHVQILLIFFVFLCTHTNLIKNLDKCNSRVLDGRHSVDEKGWCVVESDVRD